VFPENFLEPLKTLKPLFIDQKPVIPNKKSIQQYNSLSTPKPVKKTPQISTNEISPKTLEKFPLNPINKKNDQLKTNQPLTLTANKEKKPTKKELILLQKIKHLERQLKQTEIERDNLKQLVQQEKSRADNYEKQLKIIVNALKQWQKINYYQQLEQELKAQVEQPPLKPPNK